MSRCIRLLAIAGALLALASGCTGGDAGPGAVVLPANRLGADRALEVHLVASLPPGASGAVAANTAWVEYNVKLVNLTARPLTVTAITLQTEEGGHEPPGSEDAVSPSGAAEYRDRVLPAGRVVRSKGTAAGSVFFPADVRPAALVVSYRGAGEHSVTVDLKAKDDDRTGVKPVKPAE